MCSVALVCNASKTCVGWICGWFVCENSGVDAGVVVVCSVRVSCCVCSGCGEV